MENNDHTLNETEKNPRLVTVCWSGDHPPRNDLLHRSEGDAACGNQPSTNLSTDLTTAAVTDGNELCPHCDWPDGAQAVLEQRYVEGEVDQTEDQG